MMDSCLTGQASQKPRRKQRTATLTGSGGGSADNLRHAVALHYMYYNFCRIHQTLRVTPAMEAGLADHVWTLDELVGLLEHGSAADAA